MVVLLEGERFTADQIPLATNDVVIRPRDTSSPEVTITSHDEGK